MSEPDGRDPTTPTGETPAPAAPATSGEELLRHLSTAVSARGLYPGGHPLARQPLAELAEYLRGHFATTAAESVTLLLVDGELVVEGEGLRRSKSHGEGLRRALERAGVERLTLAERVSDEELAALADGLSQRRELAASDGVVLGRIVGTGGEGESAGAQRAVGGGSGIDERHLDSLAAGMALFEQQGGGGFEQLERSIWELMEATARAGRSLLLLADVRQQTEPLYRHSVATCLGALTLARSVGIAGPPLHGIAVGALLHDNGLLLLPQLLREAAAAGGEEGRAALRRHPELGAARLAGIDGVPDVAILIAYEHHLRWDGEEGGEEGGYPRIGRKPGFGAQITAVVDCWDSLYNIAGDYPRKERRRLAAIAVGRRAGKALNPRLAAGWLRLMGFKVEGGG